MIAKLKSHMTRREIGVMLNESELSTKLANGDSEAWVTFFEFLTPRIRETLERLSDHPGKREDALSEICAAVIKTFGAMTRTERQKMGL